MSTGLPALSQQHLEQLLANYGRAVARRRWRWLITVAALVVLTALAGHYSEVDLRNLLHHLSGVTSYFGRIMPNLRADHLTGDVADWYWNLSGWFRLLFDTVLIAYLATLTGTIGPGCCHASPPKTSDQARRCAGPSSGCLSSAVRCRTWSLP